MGSANNDDSLRKIDNQRLERTITNNQRGNYVIR